MISTRLADVFSVMEPYFKLSYFPWCNFVANIDRRLQLTEAQTGGFTYNRKLIVAK